MRVEAGQLSHRGIFSLSSSFSFSHVPPPPTSRPIYQPQGPYPSLKAQIPVLRPKSLKAGIWALKMGLCENIGHRSHRGRCPMISQRGIFSSFFFVSPQRPGPYLGLEDHISASRPKSRLVVQISTLKPKSHLQGPNPSLKGFGRKAEIWASRLRYGPRG